MRPRKTNLIYLIDTECRQNKENEVNKVDVAWDAFLLRLFCQKNEVENEVFILISRYNVTESTNVSTDRDEIPVF